MFTNNEEANAIMCRICHCENTTELIQSPCLCKGSMGFVHIGCLEQWLNTSSRSLCEICSYRFEVRQVRRYTICQSIAAWLYRDCYKIFQCLILILFLSLLSLFVIALCWCRYMIVVESIIAIIRDEEDRKRNNDEMVINVVQDSIKLQNNLCIYILYTFLVVYCIPVFSVTCYSLLKCLYDDWYQFWNESVRLRLQLFLDSQHYKITKKEEANNVSPNLDAEHQNIEDRY